MSSGSSRTVESAADLLDQALQLELVDARQTEELQRAPSLADPAELGKELVSRGWLTAFQAAELLHGRGADLILGRYCLLEPLGGGGMGQVFKAWHRLMRRVVALKVIRPDLLDRPETVQRFRREIQLAAQLKHPHIVTAYDAEKVGERHCLVMEYCEGKTLAEHVRQAGPLPVGTACAYVRQATLGLQHAHGCRLVHRDIKPDNLLLTDGGVKILDFGLARFRDPLAADNKLTRLGTVLGTPDFMSPEQAEELHAADARSDLYSLGCTFFFLLAGQVPFPGGTAAEKLLRQQVETPPPLERFRADVPPTVQAIVSRLTAKDPAQRFQTAEELAAALEPLAREESSPPEFPAPGEDPGATEGWSTGPVATYRMRLPAREAARSPAATPPSGKRRWLFLAGAAGLLSAVVLWFVVQTPDKGPGPPQGGVPSPEAKPLSWNWRPGPQATPKTAAAFRQLALTPDGKWLALAGGNRVKPEGPGEVTLWRVGRTELAHRRTWSLACPAGAVAFSPDGKWLAWGGAATLPETPLITVWDVEKDREVVRLGGHEKGLSSLAFGPGGVLVSGGADGTVLLWEVPSGKPTGRLGQQRGIVRGLGFTASGKVLVGGIDRTVRLWDVAAAAELRPLLDRTVPGGIHNLAISANGQTVAAVVAASKEAPAGIKLWDVATRVPRPGWLHQGATTYAVALTPDGAVVLAAQQDNGVVLWDVNGPRAAVVVPGHAGPAFALALSGDDGSVLASAGLNRTVRVSFRAEP